MSFETLREAVSDEIFDYQILMHHLQEYKKPRDKITRLIEEKAIIRVKKGLYIFGINFQQTPLSYETLANVIYTPSYVSLEYALAKYDLIPERVYGITSVSLNRTKTFTNEVGTFIYKKRPLKGYPVGIKTETSLNKANFLIAEPEKALVDLIYGNKDIKSIKNMKDFLYENMRMEQSDLVQLNSKLLKKILDDYQLPETLIKAIYD